MNLNHIAKKPFLDWFYRKPIMAHFLRAALYDAGTVIDNQVVGSKGVLRFNTELQRAQNPQLNIAVKMCEDIKKKGNHITAILSVSDLL